MSRSPSSVTTNEQFGTKPGIRARALVAGFAAAAASSACLNFDPFGCQDNSECDVEAMGVCQTVGYCSYPDPTCPDTGYRFEDNAGDDLGGECVVPMTLTGTAGPGTNTNSAQTETDPSSGPTTEPDPDSTSDDGPTTGDECGGGGQACCSMGDPCAPGLECREGVCGCVQFVAVGDRHTCAVKLDGTVWCWGDNAQNQLATPSEMLPSSPDPRQIPDVAGVTVLIAARNHTCAVEGTGDLTCWGDNTTNKASPSDTSPTVVAPAPGGLWGASMVEQVGVGGTHTCVGRTGSGPLCWGANTSGQLTGAEPMPLLPVNLPLVMGLAQIVLGEAHSCTRTATGGLECWGDNTYGQLGVDSVITPTNPTPQVIPAAQPAAHAVSGRHHMCVLSGSTVLCWGRNNLGQLGINSQVDTFTPTMVVFPPEAGNIRTLVAAADQTCAVTLTDDLYCWGGNQNGELLLEQDKMGEDGFTLTPQAINLGFSIAQIDTGDTHSCALDTQGQLLCWGRNNLGQIGDGTMTTALQPTPVQLSCP